MHGAIASDICVVKKIINFSIKNLTVCQTQNLLKKQ